MGVGAQSNKCEMAVGKAGVGPLRSGSAYFELTCSSRVSLSALAGRRGAAVSASGKMAVMRC